MKNKTILALLFISILSFNIAKAQRVNIDESKVTPYNLENPLVFANGKNVETIDDWRLRREEILELFQNEMYGRMPHSSEVYIEEIEQGVTMAGYATRRQVRMWFDKSKKGQSIDWLILYPTHTGNEPIPAVISLNYDGNHSIIKDKEVLIDETIFAVDNDKVVERGYGHGENTLYPVEMLLSKGIAFVTACYLDISPDPGTPEAQENHAYTGIFDLWGKRDKSKDNNTTSLMAWAWALCRGLDMIEKDSVIDASRVMVTGCSRLAKAALLAGAFDQRFKVVAPIQTGGGGVPLAKRNFGENVTTENQMFTHWYCKAYRKYAGHENSMPFDQHLLCACIAPRYLIVGGFNQPWFDTKGEFLSLQAASPVWEKFCGSGLPRVSFPENYSTNAIGKYIGYYRRPNEHGIYAVDWNNIMNFASAPLQLNDDFNSLSKRIGICSSKENAQLVANGGGSYLEVSVCSFLVPESPWEEFQKNLQSIKDSPIPVIYANCFFPGNMVLMGPKVDTSQIIKYVTETMKRAKEAGIRTIVLGSGNSRRIPDNIDRDYAIMQFCELLRKIGSIARNYSVTVVLEPLRKEETNFINSVREGIAIVKQINDSNIRLLADIYHMTQVGEDAGAIIEAGDILEHCHIAENRRRTSPGTDGDDFGPYLRALRGISYKGSISIECGWSNLSLEVAKSILEVKRQIFEN